MFHFASFSHLQITICSVEAQGFLACCVCDKYYTDIKGLVSWILWEVSIGCTMYIWEL